MAYKKECVLIDRECIECRECDRCDLNPNKTCDNCCVCIDKGADFKSIEIDEIIEDDDTALEQEDLEAWKYDEDYIVDYSEDESGKSNKTSVRRLKSSDN